MQNIKKCMFAKFRQYETVSYFLKFLEKLKIFRKLSFLKCDYMQQQQNISQLDCDVQCTVDFI